MDKASWGAKNRADLFYFDDDALTIVTDAHHPLYDPHRVVVEPSAAFCANINANGVIEPVVVRLNGKDGKGSPIVEVVVGRRRVRAVRIVNKERRRQGLTPLRIPAVPRRGTNLEMMGVMIAENEHREGDTMLAKAEKAKRFLNEGGSEEECACHFGVDTQTVKAWLDLFDCDDEVRLAVEQGVVAPTIARKMKNLPRDKQKELLAEMISKGATKGATAAATVERAVKKSTTPTLTSASASPTEEEPGKSKKKGKSKTEVEVVEEEVLANIPAKPFLKRLRAALLEAIEEAGWSEQNIAIAKASAQVIGYAIEGSKLPRVVQGVCDKVAAEYTVKKQESAQKRFAKKAEKAGVLSGKAHDEDLDESEPNEVASDDEVDDFVAKASSFCSQCNGQAFFGPAGAQKPCKGCDGEGSREAEEVIKAQAVGDADSNAAE